MKRKDYGYDGAEVNSTMDPHGLIEDAVIIPEEIIVGTGTPEGTVDAAKGIVYIDDANGNLYVKTTALGTLTGWALNEATSGAVALSAVAESIVPDTDEARSLGTSLKKFLKGFFASIGVGTIDITKAGGTLEIRESAVPSPVRMGQTIFGTANVKIIPYTGNPEGALTADAGSICLEITNGKLYFKSSGTGSTGWTEITGLMNGKLMPTEFYSQPAPVIEILNGTITPTEFYTELRTEGGATTDELTTVNGGSVGQFLLLKQENAANDVLIKDGTGNLRLQGDCQFTSHLDRLLLMYDDAVWVEVSRSIQSDVYDGYAGGGGGFTPSYAETYLGRNASGQSTTAVTTLTPTPNEMTPVPVVVTGIADRQPVAGLNVGSHTIDVTDGSITVGAAQGGIYQVDYTITPSLLQKVSDSSNYTGFGFFEVMVNGVGTGKGTSMINTSATYTNNEKESQSGQAIVSLNAGDKVQVGVSVSSTGNDMKWHLYPPTLRLVRIA